jgi:hypothetical protein
MPDIKKHPSGRPIVRHERKGMPIERNPGIGPLCPRLRAPEPKDAIGFHHFLIRDSDDD